MDAVISLFQCGFVFLFGSDYGFYLYLSQDRRSPQSSVFFSLDSDLRICFQRMDGFCYQILPDWWTYVPLLTPLLILKAIHRLQQRTLNSFHCKDHKENEEETLVQHATYHTRFLKTLLSKWDEILAPNPFSDFSLPVHDDAGKFNVPYKESLANVRSINNIAELIVFVHFSGTSMRS